MSLRKEIEANMRNKLAKQYTPQIKELTERLEIVSKKLLDSQSENKKLVSEIDRLNKELDSITNNLNSLIEILNLPPDIRKDALNKFQIELEVSNKLNEFLNSPTVNIYKSLISM